MRLYPVLALMTSAFALAACGGGGGGFGSSVLGSSMQVGSQCPLTTPDATPDANCGTEEEEETPVVTIVDQDNDGIDDNATDGNGNPVDNNGTTGSGAGGNTTEMTTGNRTIFMKSFVYDAPTTTGATSALSQLTSDSSATFDGTVAAILHPTNKPKKLKYAIDTKSTSNTNVAVQVEMEDSRPGSRELGWLYMGYHNITTPVTNGHPDLLDANGFRTVIYDPIANKYKYTVTDTDLSDGSVDFRAGDTANFRDDQFWNQLVGMMDERANGGAKGGYREYRTASTSADRDELMQVWAWDKSYAVHYQNAKGGGTPSQHAWSFGGDAATAMPTGGKATYKGRFVANAKTSNWVQDSGSDINPNALWRVEGNSSFEADFGNGDVTGTLKAETWQSDQAGRPGFVWYTSEADTPSATFLNPTLFPNYAEIYESEVHIAGKLPIAADGTRGNAFSGTATMDENFLTGDNAAHGGFFGTNGNELTGVFASEGIAVYPEGGSNGINDNKRGFITITGAFNADCNNPGGVCAP